MSEHNTIVTYRQLAKVFDRQDLEEFRHAASDIPKSRTSRMVSALSSSVARFFDTYERFDTRDRQETYRPILESTAEQPLSLLQGFLADRAEEIGAIEPLPEGGFEAKLDSFKIQIPDKRKWITELSQTLDPFDKERVPYNESDRLGWFGSFFTMWRALKRHPWLEDATDEGIPSHFRLAMIGDWATGMYGAPISARSIESDPKGYDAVLHLGDIYYTGTESEVKTRFLPFWPRPQAARLRALNANHEMYTGGHGYFNFVLPSFSQSASYFAFSNDHWVLVGLDTAYAQWLNPFREGCLTDDQVRWLISLVKLHKGKRFILFTHHYPYSLVDWYKPKHRFKPQRSKLFSQLHKFFRSNLIFAWYWGHEHRCLLYEQDPRGGYFGRCVGHGGFPYSRDRAPWIVGSPGMSKRGVTWRYLTGVHQMPNALLLDGPNPYVNSNPDDYGTQGYMTIELSGRHINEIVQLPDGTTIYDKQLA